MSTFPTLVEAMRLEERDLRERGAFDMADLFRQLADSFELACPLVPLSCESPVRGFGGAS